MNASIRFTLILLLGCTAACDDSPTSPTPTAPGGLMPRLSSIQTIIFKRLSYCQMLWMGPGT